MTFTKSGLSKLKITQCPLINTMATLICLSLTYSHDTDLFTSNLHISF